MATNDPFACFGDDDDESDVDSIKEPIENDRDRGRHLTEAYNANNNKKTKTNLPTQVPPSIKHASENSSSSASPSPSFRSSYEDQRTRTAHLPWPRRPPLYLGPMHLSNTLVDEGGGRGYVATQDLPPGTCVLIEEPCVKGWSEEQVGKRLGLESIRYLLEMEREGGDDDDNGDAGGGGDAQSIVRCMEELHPRKEKVDALFREDDPRVEPSSATIPAATASNVAMDPLDKIQIVDMISDMINDASHVQQAKALVAYAKERGVTNSDGSPLVERDIHRLLLTLRYNGFDSGLYLHFSMFNHNEDPNCIKFRPSPTNANMVGVEVVGGGADQEMTTAREGCYYSEARTSRRVRKGEALSLHYVENPREVSHATRRKILYDQHRFDIGDEINYKSFLDATMTKTGHLFNDNERGSHIFESELVGGKFPVSSREGNNNNGKVGDGESDDDLPKTQHIEKSLDDLEDMMKELQSIFKLQPAGNTDDGSFDRAAALELTVCELISASQSALGNDHHILISRCRRLHLDSIEVLLSQCASVLTEKQSIELMTRFLPSAHHLLELQRRRLGRDHPDVARTCNDFSMGIQALLAHSPKRLISLKMDGMTTLDLCSRMEHSCQMEKRRIEEMYPTDVDEILRSVSKK